MTELQTLASHLADWAGTDRERSEVALTVAALAEAGKEISALVALGPLAGELARILGENNGGDTQKLLDLTTHRIVEAALRSASVAVMGSEESDAPVLLDPAGVLAVAIDPLDGSSNIDTNVSIGTIFSILPMLVGAPEASLLPL